MLDHFVHGSSYIYDEVETGIGKCGFQLSNQYVKKSDNDLEAVEGDGLD